MIQDNVRIPLHKRCGRGGLGTTAWSQMKILAVTTLVEQTELAAEARSQEGQTGAKGDKGNGILQAPEGTQVNSLSSGGPDKHLTMQI